MHDSAKRLAQPVSGTLACTVGKVLHVPGAVTGNVDGVASGQKLVVALAKEFVAKFQGAILGFEDAGAHGEEFIVAGGVMIAAMNVGNDDEGIVLDFHEFVIEAERAHQFDAADFKPDQVIGVIHNAHLVGFGVAHTYGDIVMSQHESRG